MTFDGYMRFGGVEVINSERARGLSQSAGCPMYWLKGDACAGLVDALGDTSYDSGDLTASPWYDATAPDVSGRFYGVFGLAIKGVEDSTRTATFTQNLEAGGVMGRARRATRAVKFSVLLMGRGQDAVEYGMGWLDAVLDPEGCRDTGGDCGTAEMSVFGACPPVRTGVETTPQYQARVNPLRRFMRNTGPVSGPFVVEEMEVNGNWAYRVEFTLEGGPAVVGVARRVFDSAVTPVPPSVFQDVPYNLAVAPSAGVGGSSVVVATNLSTNPSVEVNATDWVAASSVSSGTNPAAFVTSGRSTDIGAGGSSASFRLRLLGDAGVTPVSGAVSDLDVYQEAAIAAGSNRRISINIWGALLLISGSSSVLTSLVASYEFFAGASSLGSATIASALTSEFGGRAFSAKGIAVPSTATKVRVGLRARATWYSSATGTINSDIRLYGDALAVTIP